MQSSSRLESNRKFANTTRCGHICGLIQTADEWIRSMYETNNTKTIMEIFSPQQSLHFWTTYSSTSSCISQKTTNWIPWPFPPSHFQFKLLKPVKSMYFRENNITWLIVNLMFCFPIRTASSARCLLENPVLEPARTRIDSSWNSVLCQRPVKSNFKQRASRGEERELNLPSCTIYRSKTQIKAKKTKGRKLPVK